MHACTIMPALAIIPTQLWLPQFPPSAAYTLSRGVFCLTSSFGHHIGHPTLHVIYSMRALASHAP